MKRLLREIGSLDTLRNAGKLKVPEAYRRTFESLEILLHSEAYRVRE